MCGLFGFIDPKHSLYPKQAQRLINALAHASMERGTDATGIAYTSAGQLSVFKRPLSADKMRLHPHADSVSVMGHVRMTTQGDAKFNCNNHPFTGRFGNGGPDFALAHNGVLSNDRQLALQHNLPPTAIETDSYVAVQLLEAAGALNLETIKKMAEALEGTFTLTVLDRFDDFYFVRGNNPLTIWHYPRLGLYVYASTATILKEAVSHIRYLRKMPHEEVSVAEGEILLLCADGSMERSRFTVRPFYRFHYAIWEDWSQFDDFPAKTQPNKNKQPDAVMDVLGEAVNYGYEDGDIELLLDYGYSYDEIEMMLGEPYQFRAAVQEAVYHMMLV